MNFITKQVSSLQRVFLDGKCDLKEYNTDSALKGERFSYQIAYKSDEKFFAEIIIDSLFLNTSASGRSATFRRSCPFTNGITNTAKEAKPDFFPMCFFRLRTTEY